ncbi:MAG: phage tail protein [Gemmatimonadota bacterium]
MAATGDRVDPFQSFRFLVRIDRDTLGGFSEVSGLQAEVEVQELPEGGVNTFVHKLPGRARHGNLTLRRGLVTRALWDWFNQIARGEITRKAIAVELLNAPGEDVVMRWVFESTFPARWTGPELKADQSAIAVESVELAHHGFRVET